jgi:hypothetical protein
MQKRDVREADVAEVLANPDRERPGDDPMTVVRFGTTSSGRKLKIVQPVNDPNFVITIAVRGEWP